MAFPVAISSTAVITWTTTVVGSLPICHISLCNLPGLDEHGSATTSIVDLMAISDAAAKDPTRIKDMLLHSQYALCALSTENQHQK